MLARKITSLVIIGFYFVLVCFGIISLLKPVWLTRLSQPGRAVEARTYIDEANQLMYQQKFAEAVRYFSESLKIDSMNKNTYGNIANAYIQLGNFGAAAENLNRMHGMLQGMDSLVYFNFYLSMADLLKGIGNQKLSEGSDSEREFNSAFYYYRKAIGQMPYSPIVYYKYAHLAQQRGLDSLAFRMYRKGIGRNLDVETYYQQPLYEEYLIAIAGEKPETANDILGLMRTQEPIPWERYDTLLIREYCFRDKYLGRAYANLGEILLRKGDAERASELFATSLQIDPELAQFIKQIKAQNGIPD